MFLRACLSRDSMIDSILTLLFCQLLGEVVVRGLGLPLPGPVAGMGFLLVLLMLRGRMTGAQDLPEGLTRVTDGLLGNLSLLFVPAAVGVVRYGGLLRSHGLVMALAVLVSTILALAVTALVFLGTRILLERRR